MDDRTLLIPDDPRLRQLRELARLLDSSIPVPGTRWRFGLDALIGLVPGVGDVAGGVIGGWVVLQAARLGAPAAVLARMVGNLALEAVVGAVPFAGDLFDAAYKANRRNVALLERHLGNPAGTARASRGWVGGVLVALLLIVVGAAALAIWLLGALLDAVGLG